RMSPDWTEMRFLDGKGMIADTRNPDTEWLGTYLHPDDRPRMMEAIQAAIRGRSMFELVHRVLRVDGTLGWVHSRAVPLFSPDGEIAEWFGAAGDVSDLLRTESRLFEEHERLEALMRSLPVGVAISGNRRCEQVTGNATLLALLGAGPVENISASAPDPDAFGRRVIYLRDGMPIPDSELPMQRAARGGETVPPTEVQILTPDGRSSFAEMSAAPICNEQGEVTGGVAVVMDVTALRQAKETREQARLKDEFLAILGHELRNPLAAISNALQVLSGVVSQEQRASLEELMRRQTGVLKRLVDDLLEVSRITHGRIRLQREGVDLSELLRAAAAAARLAMTERAQELVVIEPPSPVSFLADGVRMRQVAANLLDNASKYTDRGGRIQLSGSLEGPDVVLRCKDNGRGIPLDMQQKIFEPLIRAETAGQSDSSGLGLGLTLVKRLAELHGGSVSVRSGGPGTGSEFRVRLPFIAAEPDAGSLSITASLPPRNGLSFVIVEDNRDVSETLALSLRQAGHRVAEFSEGASALEGISSIDPDAVFLDIGLPGLDGYEVLARMKEQEHLRKTLFIGISGFAPSARGQDHGAQFDRYLIKPVNVAEVLNLVTLRRQQTAAGPIRALLVEDYADLAAATAAILRAEGIDVVVAATGREALRAEEEFRPQLILCDMNLPDMSGLDVVRTIRESPGREATHVAIVTARSERDLRAYNKKARKLGVDEFIAKPIAPETIHALIGALTDPKQPEGEGTPAPSAHAMSADSGS
ncbi:MAG: response regulator, partial [Acidobacteriota bacterium]|nr:response regulator [Acidobacteriota bacterium]